LIFISSSRLLYDFLIWKLLNQDLKLG
jgi:hypothetical protein